MKRGLNIIASGVVGIAALLFCIYPAFKVDKDTGQAYEAPRGCGNSGILSFAAELDAEVAARWYREHEATFWKQNVWLVGFTERPRGSREAYSDVDSGPVAWEFGSMATVFGIGASKAVGRIDRAAPMTMEAVACSWPTPFGFVIPAVMGKLAAGSGCLGETALAFVMTRPVCVKEVVPFSGCAPLIVWVMFFLCGGRPVVHRG